MIAGKKDPIKKSRQGPEPIIHIGGHTYKQGRTGELIASIAGVSEDTVRKSEIIEKEVWQKPIKTDRRGKVQSIAPSIMFKKGYEEWEAPGWKIIWSLVIRQPRTT